MNSDEMKKINELLSDPMFIKLSEKYGKKGLLTMYSKADREQWHSSFLCWLFSYGHSLSGYALERMLYLYNIKACMNPKAEKLDIGEIIGLTDSKAGFITERVISTGDCIDIFCELETHIIVIDVNINKPVKNENGELKTSLFYSYFNSKYNKKKKLYISLSAEPEETDQHFIGIDFQELYDEVISKCLENPMISDEEKSNLNEYVLNLNYKIKGNRLALTNKELCGNIYEKHSVILDAVYSGYQNGDGKTRSNKEYIDLYDRYEEILSEIYCCVNGKAPSGRALTGKDLLKYMVKNECVSVRDEFVIAHDFSNNTSVFTTADVVDENTLYVEFVILNDKVGDKPLDDVYREAKELIKSDEKKLIVIGNVISFSEAVAAITERMNNMFKDKYFSWNENANNIWVRSTDKKSVSDILNEL